MTNQCAHGQLERVCPLCERDKEIERLRTIISGKTPTEVIHTVGIGYCDNCNCEHCSEIRNP